MTSIAPGERRDMTEFGLRLVVRAALVTGARAAAPCGRRS